MSAKARIFDFQKIRKYIDVDTSATVVELHNRRNALDRACRRMMFSK